MPDRTARPIAALLALAATLAAAPARGADLVVWTYHRTREREAFARLVEQFNAHRGADAPRVKVIASDSFDGFADRISAAVPRGRGPDAFVYLQDRLGGWVDTGGIVEPLDRLLDAPMRERFIPVTLRAHTYHGTLYAMPFSYKTVTLIYNPALVATPPRTTAELASVAGALTHRDQGAYAIVYPYDNYYYHAVVQNAFGGGPFDEAMHPMLDRPENLAAMELVLKWRKAFLPDRAPDEDATVRMFNEGKAAMIVMGPWDTGDIKVPYRLATLPVVSEAGDRPMRPWLSVEGIFVTAPSQQKELAYEFIKFATDLPAARTMAREGGQCPANQHVYVDPELLKDQQLATYFSQVRVAVPMPNGVEMTAMWGPATGAMGSGLYTTTPEVALAKAQQQLVERITKLKASKK